MAGKRRPTDTLTADSWESASADLLIRYLRKWYGDGDDIPKRRYRLVHVGFCRLHWADLPDNLGRRAVELGERYADGGTDFDTLKAANDAHWERHGERSRSGAKRDLAFWLSAWASHASDPYGGHVHNGWNAQSRAKTAVLVRDIFGNPFRSVVLDLAWRTSTVLALAHSMYESRDFAAMPVLADALEEAGCGDAAILSHCRGGPHVRGCWVVDLVLGKA